MSQACPGFDGQNALASTMLELVDCQLGNAVEQSYGLLTRAGSPFGTAITLALTIYVALIGYRLILGRSRLTLGDLAPRLIAIGVVLALATNWGTYQRLVYDLFTNGPAEAARWVSGSADAPQLMARVDETAATLVEISDAWTRLRRAPPPPAPAPAQTPTPGADPAAQAPQAQQTPPAPPAATQPAVPDPGAFGTEGPTGPRMLNWSAILLLLIAAGPLLAAKIVLGILLALGPFFILLGLFAFTRGLATGWLRATAYLALVPLLSTLSTAGALLLVDPLTSRLAADAADGRFSTLQALALFAGLIVLAGATLLLLRVALIIASGWTVDLRRAAADPQPGSAAAQAGSATSLALPRADQLAFALERAAAGDPGRIAPATPPAFRIEIPTASAGGAGSADPLPGRRIGQASTRSALPPAIRPLRAGEAL